jgi:hypothetical protein
MQNDLGSTKYGMALLPQATADVSGLDNALAPSPAGNAGQFHPDNPMLWLLGIGALTLGLVAASTHVRVGPITASVAAGK